MRIKNVVQPRDTSPASYAAAHEATGEPPQPTPTEPAAESDPFESIWRGVERCAKDIRKLIAAKMMSEHEADQVWLEMHELIETEWTNSPAPARSISVNHERRVFDEQT